MTLSHHSLKKAGKICLWIFGSLMAFIVIFILFITTPYFAGVAGSWLTTKSGRHIGMQGHIEMHVWQREPRFIFHDVKIANADWSTAPTMFEASRVELSIRVFELFKGRIVLPELILEQPKLALEKNADGKANWDFSQNPQSQLVKQPLPEKRSNMPIIRHLQVSDGALTYKDPKEHIDTTLKVNTITGGANEEENIALKGEGSYQDEPFLLEISGASILQLRDSNKPYPFSLKTTIGKTSVAAQGSVQDPMKMEAVDVTLDLKGANAADLFPLTGIALPPTPAYEVSGHMTGNEQNWHFENFKGRLGNSDLHGDVLWHANQKPPYFEGNFISENLDLKDLSGFIGAHKKPSDANHVLPDTPLDISRLTAMNADVTFQGNHVKAPELLNKFHMIVHLKDGVLQVKPVSFDIAQGKINANIEIQGLNNPPITTLDVSFDNLSLNDLFAPLARNFGKDNVSSGLLDGKAALKGSGKSLHEMLSNANGVIGIGMSGGQLSQLLLNLAGLDILRTAGIIVTGDKPIAIDCMVGDFAVESGVVNTKGFLIDTDITTIHGKGQIELHNEDIDMRLHVHPKKASLSVRTPILIDGKLKHPSIGLDPAALAARGGVAAILGTLLTPAAAAVAFMDPGRPDKSECPEFLDRMNQDTGSHISLSPDN